MTATLAISEFIMGQLIAATPPTAAVIMTLIVLRAGQKRNALALDGKLTQLMNAEKGVSRAEGVAQERIEERDRTAGVPQPVTVENPPDSPVIVKSVETHHGS